MEITPISNSRLGHFGEGDFLAFSRNRNQIHQFSDRRLLEILYSVVGTVHSSSSSNTAAAAKTTTTKIVGGFLTGIKLWPPDC